MFYVYDKETTRFAIKHTYSGKIYKTEAAAKAAITRLGLDKDAVAIAEVNEFHNNIEKQVTRTNLMSGKEFQEPVNTPIFCSPAFESYYSM